MRASIEGQHELAARVQTALSLPTKKHAENVIDAVLGSLKTTLLNHKEKNYAGRQEDRLKTANADRTVELHSSVAQLLREHIGTRETGWVFENKKRKALCASNLLKRVLHPILLGSEKTPGVTGTKAGEHAFRRYRDGHLRRSNCPDGLLKYWLGHSLHQDMSDLYDGSVMDEAYRLEMSEKLGTGFNVPSCTECTEEEKEATGAVASK